MSLLLAVTMCASLSAFAQPKPATPNPAPKAQPEENLEERAMEAIAAKDWVKAQEWLLKMVDAGKGKFTPYYNLACVRAVQGDKAGAMDWLVQSIERGFSDLRQMRRDSYLKTLGDEPAFKKLVEAWPVFLDKRVEKDVELAKKLFEARFAEERDAKQRLVFLSSFDAAAFSDARIEVRQVVRWATLDEKSVFKGMMDGPDANLDAWVLVVLPKGEAFGRWAQLMFGPAAMSSTSMIGGAYVHDDKRLVSQDTGATLRHEFMHVLHWRDMDRRGQRHPIYVQEGLCSLTEDFDVVPGTDVDGVKAIKLASSWRTNIAKRRERGGTLIPIETMAAMPHEKFMGYRPLANYAIARTLFLWLEREGKLSDWYADYTTNFGEDPTGVKSFARIMGGEAKSIAEANKRFKAWVRALPEVPEEIARGMASLGLDIETGEGDGVSVVGFGPRIKDRKSRPVGNEPLVWKVEEGEIRKGDVIRSINGRPTREMAELVRVLSGFHPGETVELAIRRGKQSVTAKVALVAKQ
ncbi:MAG: PDZ domain-containing protein [Planctomycetota bacterium]